MKKVVSILISALIILSLCFCVSAENSGDFIAQSKPIKLKNYMDNTRSGGGESNQIEYNLFDESTVNRLKNALISAADNVENIVDISAENITVPITGIAYNEGAGNYDYDGSIGKIVRNNDRTGNYDIMLDINDISNVFSELYYGNEFFFHVYSFGYSYSLPYEVSVDLENESTTIPALAIYYNMTKSDYNIAKSFCIRKMDDIISRMDDDFTIVDKLLFIHDYFVENFSYQFDDSDANMYHFFSQNGGVCQSYTLAYMGILNRLGIDNTVAISDPGNHIWNIAKLEDNSYYHIDCTQDDPTWGEYDLPGFVRHDLFLLSDEGLIYADNIKVQEGLSASHVEWYTIPFLQETVSCDNARFDYADWRNTIGRFSCVGDKWYAITPTLPTNIYSFSKGTLENTTLVNTYNSGYDVDYYSPRSVVQLGTMICFSDAFEVVSYDVLNNRFATMIETDYQLIGCFDTKMGQMGYYFEEYFSEGTPYETLNLGIGDINQDGYLAADDLACIVSFILKEENQTYNYYFADLNFDGRVNIADLVRYKKFLASLV